MSEIPVERVLCPLFPHLNLSSRRNVSNHVELCLPRVCPNQYATLFPPSSETMAPPPHSSFSVDDLSSFRIIENIYQDLSISAPTTQNLWAYSLAFSCFVLISEESIVFLINTPNVLAAS